MRAYLPPAGFMTDVTCELTGMASDVVLVDKVFVLDLVLFASLALLPSFTFNSTHSVHIVKLSMILSSPDSSVYIRRSIYVMPEWQVSK